MTQQLLQKLPNKLPLFIKDGALLLPNEYLPLIITEDHYIQMVDDTLKKDRLLGVIQPKEKDSSEIFNSGCIGKITTFSETIEESYFIILQGICRFDIIKESRKTKPYRQVEVSLERYLNDLDHKSTLDVDRDRLLSALKKYFEVNNLSVNWEDILSTPSKKLITAIAMTYPFKSNEKQALLELPTLEELCCMMTSIIEMDSMEQNDTIKH